MRFIDQANNGNNSISSYIQGILLIVVGFITFQLLLLFLLPKIYDGIEIESLSTTKEFIGLLGKNGFFIFSLMPYCFLVLLVLFSVKFVHKRSLKSSFTGREKFDWRRVFISFFLMLSILAIMFVIQFFTENTLRYNFNSELFFPLLIAALFLIPFQILAEELLFRSYVLQGLKKRIKHNGHSVLISGIMFGMLHLGNPEIFEIGFHLIIYYVGAGIFLGLITLFDDGIELSVGYHAANNLFGVLIISSDWQVFQTNALYVDTSLPGNGIGSIVFSIILFTLLFFLYSKIFNWKGLKEIWND